MRSRKSFLVATLTAIGAAAAVSVAAAPAQAQTSIVGGGTVGTAPSWAAVIGDSSGMWCSGELVSNQWVLTAAHCDGATRIRIGSKNTNSGGTLVGVSNWVRNPNYSGVGYDFSLYKLSQPVSNAPIAIATSSPGSGTTVAEYGYGQTCPQYGCGGMSSTLRTVNTSVVADSQCSGIQGSVELCFDTSTTATDCYGDSGGPAVVNGQLVGVDSRGANGTGSSTCGRTNSIYGDATSVRSWILTTIGS